MTDSPHVDLTEDLSARLARLLTPVRGGSSSGTISVAEFHTELGWMIAGAMQGKLVFVEFAEAPTLGRRLERLADLSGCVFKEDGGPVLENIREEMTAYFAGAIRTFRTPVHLLGSPFQKSVWHALESVPYGATVSYGSLADRLGCPGAVRAVARANASNRLAVVIPCHRVIGRNGKLTGYAGGLERKRRLLDLEAGIVGRPVQAGLF